MIEWFAYVQIGIAVLAGGFCIVSSLVGQKPNDFTLGVTAVVELLLLAQLVVAIFAPACQNAPVGSGLEFYTYLVTAIILLPVAAFWALIERNRFSTAVLGIANLAIAIMLYRMLHIWLFQSA